MKGLVIINLMKTVIIEKVINNVTKKEEIYIIVWYFIEN